MAPILFGFEGGGDELKLVPVKGLPRLHTTPLVKLIVEEGRVIVEADDSAERRWRFFFEPYQAVRVTTADCFETPGQLTLIPQTVVEVVGSGWISALTAALNRMDQTGTFMGKANHYLLPLQDEFLEVVAWGVRCEPCPTQKPHPG